MSEEPRNRWKADRGRQAMKHDREYVVVVEKRRCLASCILRGGCSVQALPKLCKPVPWAPTCLHQRVPPLSPSQANQCKECISCIVRGTINTRRTAHSSLPHYPTPLISRSPRNTVYSARSQLNSASATALPRPAQRAASVPPPNYQCRYAW
jgi:hypothetical protein